MLGIQFMSIKLNRAIHYKKRTLNRRLKTIHLLLNIQYHLIRLIIKNHSQFLR